MTVATETAIPVPENVWDNMTDGELLHLLCTQIVTLTESHNRLLALLESVEGQIAPVIQSMSSGPIGKLMGL